MPKSTAKPPKLTPTSYVLLGLLARQPQSAYELITLMQSSLIRVYWPRVESHVYSEPKNLLLHKLVSEKKETLNGRNRTVYSITDKGALALKRWLADDANLDLRMQAEFMLKLLLADSGTSADIHNTLGKSLARSHADLEEAIAGVRKILDAEQHPKHGAPYNGIGINLMADILIARYRWGLYAQQTARGIDESTPMEDKIGIGKQAYADALAKMEEALQDLG